MAGPAKKRHGKGGRMVVNGITMTSRDLSVDFRGNADDVTNHGDYNSSTNVLNKTSKMGVVYCAIRGTVVWDAGACSFDDPPGLYPRDDLSNVYIYVNVPDNTQFQFPIVTVNSVSIKISTSGAVMFDCDMESNGSFSIPSGSV